MLRHLPSSLRAAPLLLPGSRTSADTALPAVRKAAAAHPEFPASLNLAEMEASFVHEALRRSGNNRSSAAKLLGISRRTLHRKLHELGLASAEDPAE